MHDDNICPFNPIALRTAKAKSLRSFGRSEYIRVKGGLEDNHETA